MHNRNIAETLMKEAKEFNFFGAANLRGMNFQINLLEKYKTWKKDSSISFTEEELSLLKPVIAQSLIEEEMKPLACYPVDSDQHLSQVQRTQERTLSCLRIAKTYAKCGSFNCDIGKLVLCLALIKKLTIPIEVVNFSGV